MTKRWISDLLKRESGTPSWRGNSHAIALTCAISSGGKTTRATRAWLILQTLQALLGETFSPAPHDFRIHVQTPTDLDIRLTSSGVEHELCTLDLLIRARVTPSNMLKLTTLLGAQHDPGSRSRHHHKDSRQTTQLLPTNRPNLRRAALIWRSVCQGWSSSSDGVVGVAGALAGRHGRKVQCDRLRDQTDIRGLHLKTRCSSRLAV